MGGLRIVGVLAFERLAAVGLLSLSATSGPRLSRLAGVGTGEGALRDRASEAAVGANRPVDGVLEMEEGVLGRKVEGVLERAGVVGVLGIIGGRLEALEDGRGRAAAAAALALALGDGLIALGGVDADEDMAALKDDGGDRAGVRLDFTVVFTGVVVLDLEGVLGVGRVDGTGTGLSTGAGSGAGAG